jgi:WD40 repeat protein
MQIRRVRVVNSATSAIPSISNRGTRLRHFLSLSFLLSSSPLLAQNFAPPISISEHPNPFRQDAPSVSSSEKLSGKGLSVDVIQLACLPPLVESPVVTAISVSPDGEFIAAAGDDHAIRIVNLKSGKTTATLTAHLDWVQSVEFSPSGLQLASCGNDGTLRIWALGDSPKLIATKSTPHALMTLAYVNDDCLFVAGFSNQIYRYNAGQSDLMVVHRCDGRDIRAIVTSPDRQWIAFGGRDGVLRLRRVDTMDQEKGLANRSGDNDELAVSLHSERIRSIEFSKDGKQTVSVGEDRRIVHYDLENRRVLLQTKIEGGKLLGLCQLEPHLFAIGSSDNTIRIFNDKDQQVHAKLVGHDGSVGILKRTQQFLISGSFDTTIRIWDIGRAVASIDGQGKYVHPVRAQFEDSGAGASAGADVK